MKDSVIAQFNRVLHDCYETYQTDGWRVVINGTLDHLSDMPGIRTVDIITARAKNAL